MNETLILNMNPLLPFTSPTYARRLVRALSYRSAGFYVNGERYNQARFSKSTLQVRMGSNAWTECDPASVFGDGSGDTICASRRA